jgi:hypothetical protein
VLAQVGGDWGGVLRASLVQNAGCSPQCGALRGTVAPSPCSPSKGQRTWSNSTGGTPWPLRFGVTRRAGQQQRRGSLFDRRPGDYSPNGRRFEDPPPVHLQGTLSSLKDHLGRDGVPFMCCRRRQAAPSGRVRSTLQAHLASGRIADSAELAEARREEDGGLSASPDAAMDGDEWVIGGRTVS